MVQSYKDIFTTRGLKHHINNEENEGDFRVFEGDRVNMAI